jgi:uroporphyrinogen-III synthase
MIWIGRGDSQSTPWIDAATDAGWRSMPLPLITKEPLPLDDRGRDCLDRLKEDDWIFLTSPFASRLFREQCHDRAPSKIAVVGERTGLELRPMTADLVASGHGGAQLAMEYLKRGPIADNIRHVHFTSEAPRKELHETLRNKGINIERIPAYRTTTIDGPAPEIDDHTLLFSPSAAMSLAERCPIDVHHPVMAIGPTTAEAAKRLGFTVNLTLNEPTPSELTRELMQWATTTT